jgi:membrane protease YdiL (CAAX protease family)
MTNRTGTAPTPWIGWVVGIVYAPIFIAVMIASGVRYDEFTESAANIRDAAVVPLAVVAVLMVIVITALGWWRPVLRDQVALKSLRSWWLIPAVFVVAIVVGADYGRLGQLDTEFIVWAGVASVLVGFAEESAYRGVGVVAFRARYSEFSVWLFSSLLFMYLHAFNFFAGQGFGATVAQLGFTFLMGSVFYVVRRVTRTLVIPMLLHGGWDFISFTALSDAFENPEELVDPRQLQPALLFLFVMVALFVFGFRKAFRADAAASLSAGATGSR